MTVETLIRALDYIEEHIESDIRVKDIADYCYASLSSLQKTFSYAFDISIHAYIIRRRFSLAARDLLKTEDSILDISLKYGYANVESFTRGFRKIWGVTPRDFRKNRSFTGHTPKFSLPETNVSEDGRNTKKIRYDLTEFYDVIRKRRNCAYVLADLQLLQWINDQLGFQAGDAALLELMKRMESACDEDDVFFRIGGDEFAVFTNSEEMLHAEEIVQKVSVMNGEMVKFGEMEFPVSIYIGAFKSVWKDKEDEKEMFAEINNGLEDIHQTARSI